MNINSHSNSTSMPREQKLNILHIFNDPKFSKGFFEFLIKHNENLDNHFLFHYRCTKSTYSSFGMRSLFAANFFSPFANIRLLKPLFQAEKIIIHCLASPILIFYLFLFPSLAHKSYWVIWGKDLYFYRVLSEKRFYHSIYEFFRRKVIKEIRHIVTYNDGDYKLAKEWYGTSATQHRCFMYPSNLYNNVQPPTPKNSKIISILVGNSADPSNNHLEAFSVLEKFKDENIQIIAPLSYGNKKYANEVIKAGHRIFGDKFKPYLEMIPYAEYLELLGRVEIGIFAHRRQQAMGNITTLLGMGKKVYIRDDITTWDLLKNLGIKAYKFYDIDLVKPDESIFQQNREIVKSIFSEENLLAQWNQIASDKPQ